MAPRRRKREPIKQTAPSFHKLLEHYHSGLRSRKEITRRVKDGPPNKVNEETLAAYEALRAVALENDWIQE